MIGRIAYPLSRFAELALPAVQPGKTWDDYLSALEGAVVRKNERVSLGLFRRWLDACGKPGDSVCDMQEQKIEAFAAALVAGEIKRADGRNYGRFILHQAPSNIRTLHDRAQENGAAELVRRLVPRHVSRRLLRFSALTEATRTALQWFETHGTTLGRGSHRLPKYLTTATRQGALHDALQLLDGLNKRGLEDVTIADLPDLSLESPGFKRQCRIRHGAATVYRACVAKALLPTNPLSGVSTTTFNEDARRDFLPPDELRRALDLGTLDRADARRVQERLILLLYLDLALRKNELAAVQREHVRQPSQDTFQIQLHGSSQKMGNKKSVVLDVLYPQTAELLSEYLQRRGAASGSLFFTPRGKPAGDDYMYNAVRREAARLKLMTYHKRPPSCHDLRRTFATCNADRLGLCLNPHEIAQRLRCGIDVAFECYVQSNPLLQSLKAREQRRQLANDPYKEARKHIDELRKLPVPAELLDLLQRKVDDVLSPQAVPPAEVRWTLEDEALAAINREWEADMPERKMRPYFKARDAIDRGGAHGRARYRDDVVRHLLSLTPLQNLCPGELDWRQQSSLGHEFRLEKIGRLVLVRKEDAAKIMIRLNRGARRNSAAPKRASGGLRAVAAA